ncbi:uncharacterized protein LOC107615240 [Arachis ipaensis]|uniref:uncharacterized protein LOC107615240 n=1 Tax=Arachis ipaensis TaxID=130454 RepID=UPI0007AEF632|nr:uncharacterized protein LOC107615240 [Arachis ipaensis]
MPHGSEETATGEPVEDDDLELPYLYDGPSHEAHDFTDLLTDGAEELYPGCSKYSKLSFLVKLYHIKYMCGVSDKAMSMILDLLRDAFEQAKLPSTLYEAKKTIRKLGIEYKKIDAYPNDCMLYRGDDGDATKCNKTSTDMLWHKEADNNDGYLGHPRDVEAWKEFDAKYPFFSNDLRSASFILSMIIPSFKMLGNGIDVYLEPLVDELKQLWDGVETYDANKRTTFKMHAALMLTISGFPGLKNLSGWNTYSGLACPTCNVDAKAQRLTFSQKRYYMGHRYFLNQGHKYRLDRNRFDGQAESRDPPKKYYGIDVLRSVFFELPYWKDHMLRHNLDVMHIEKNICDNVVFTILNDSVKSKDNLKAHKDLQTMGIRPELWPDEDAQVVWVEKSRQPHSNGTITSDFGEECIAESGVDCDCKFMKMIFLPSFFTVMVHLTVHLVDELKLGGPVHYRWMYPIERYLGRLKQHVRNKAQAEGSIAESYLSEKILIFCSRYLDNIETRINRPA